MGETSEDLNQQTIAACDEAKNENITVFVVNIIDGDNDVFSQCASAPDKLFSAPTLEDIDEAFGDLSSAVSDTLLYIAK